MLHATYLCDTDNTRAKPSIDKLIYSIRVQTTLTLHFSNNFSSKYIHRIKNAHVPPEPRQPVWVPNIGNYSVKQRNSATREEESMLRPPNPHRCSHNGQRGILTKEMHQSCDDSVYCYLFMATQFKDRDQKDEMTLVIEIISRTRSSMQLTAGA